MLDIKYVRENLALVQEKIGRRGSGFDAGAFAELENRRRKLIVRTEELRALRNRVSQEIPRRKKAGEDVAAQIAEMKDVGETIKDLEEGLAAVDQELQDFLLNVPNLPDDAVPPGHSEEDNVEVRRWGTPRNFDFPVKDHVDLGAALNILDLDRAAKVTGARFAIYRGAGARLERALINFMLEVQTRENGYLEVLPPFMVNADSLVGTGNLPKFEDDLFRIQNWPFYLVPTAEVPVTNFYRDEILEEAELPIRLVAFTPCFRSEAGSYGKLTRGLIRQHQFNKVELVKFCRPEESMAELESLTADAETILQRLGLPYRVVSLCTADLGFSSAKTYDIEVWLPSQQRYVEISSCSNFKDFQARRAAIRYRPAGQGKPRYLHTLNGSGLAIGRTWVALMENGQNADGSITLPEVLRPFMGGDVHIFAQATS
ncbi:MAG: serine--tRNA ligase [Acidobacteria bacterium]|nr:serine--tRNA ligase [Acidobacteriota bacterium]